MIHFKLISATNLPTSKKNKDCSCYAILYPKNFDLPSLNYYTKTKAIKNTSNPEWNQEITIPFVLCNSIRVEFWNKKAFGDELIGEGHIYFQNFSNGSPQTSIINLSASFKNFSQPTFTYSIYSTLSNFDVKPLKKTEKLYVYLTFEPPIQNDEDVQLFALGVNENGTIIDAATDLYTKGESEASHFSPSGPTQVFSFNSSLDTREGTYSLYEKYFFYVKNTSYSGIITLNFLNTPYSINTKNFLDKCIVFNNQWSVYVNNRNTNNHSYSVFPIKLHFVKKKAVVEPVQIPDFIVHQSVPDQSNDVKNNEKSLFSEAIDYYQNDLDGIAIKNIKDSMGKILCPPGKVLNYRFDIIPGNRYSLKEAFDFNNIDQHPKEIMVALGWDSGNYATDLDASILEFYGNGTNTNPICFFNHYNDNNSIYTQGDNLRGEGRGDDERLFLKLNEIPSNVKYLGITITSFRSIPFSKINGAFLRIVDCVSNKEVMYLNLSKKDDYTGLLFAVMTRLDGVWDMWPCVKFFNGYSPREAVKFFDEFVNTGVIDQMLSV